MALAGGPVEIGSAVTSAVLNSIIDGHDFVAANPTQGINDQVQSIFYVLNESPIQGIEDLPGKTVAANTLSAHLDYTMREALHQKGLDQNAANLITVPGPELDQVLLSGQVDVAAFGYWQTTFEGAAREGGGIRTIFDDTDVLGEIAGGFTVLRRNWVEAQPEAARVWIEQSARALEERGENPEVAAFFASYLVREGGRAIPRDIDFWIEILEREDKLQPDQLTSSDVLLSDKTVAAK